MDFPAYVKNEQGPPIQAITVNAPAFDANASHAKTPAAILVEQQWRDVKAFGMDKQHPLSLNRDSVLVTDDPYTS